MRIILTLLTLITVLPVSAQTLPDKMILELLNTEKDFVIAAQLKGLPYGFMKYTTKSTVGLNKHGINRVREDWDDKDKTDYAMVWKPVVVYAGEDGLHGITLGPYYFKPEKDDAFHKGGYFLSVWERKRLTDSFRLVSDCGIRFGEDNMLDEGLTVINTAKPAVTTTTAKKSFEAFKKLAKTSFSQAIIQQGVTRHTLLLSQYGMFVGSQQVKQLGVLAKGATLSTQKEIDNASLHLVIGKIEFSDNPFPDDKKLDKSGWYVQVWSKDKKMPGLLATMLYFP